MVTGQEFTITQEQIDALNALPPGVYIICAQCGEFRQSSTTWTFRNDGMICASCDKWGGPMPRKVKPNG